MSRLALTALRAHALNNKPRRLPTIVITMRGNTIPVFARFPDFQIKFARRFDVWRLIDDP